MAGEFTSKVAIVTGGASGLGLAIVEHFISARATVISTDVNETEGKRAAAENGAEFFPQDVSSESDWQRLIQHLLTRHSGADILINNAGIGEGLGPSTPEHTSWQDWERIMAVNAGGVFLGCKHIIPLMRERGGGSIVNVSSIAALVATPFITAYGASKSAVLQFTRSVAVYTANENIRCNSVHPGQIETPMLSGLFQDVADSGGLAPDQVRHDFLQRIPQGRFGQPEDIAQAVLFLCSDAASHITGSRLCIDGGMSAHP